MELLGGHKFNLAHYSTWTGSRCSTTLVTCCVSCVKTGTFEFVPHRFDLAYYLDGQPMQFMMRPRGQPDRPHFAFEMWHRKLLPAARRSAQRD